MIGLILLLTLSAMLRAGFVSEGKPVDRVDWVRLRHELALQFPQLSAVITRAGVQRNV